MKRILSTILGILLFLSSYNFSFADQGLTMEEFNQIAEDYNLNPIFIDGPLPEDAQVYRNLTKDQLISLITQARSEISPIHFEEEFDLRVEDINLDDFETSLTNEISASSTGWKTITKPATLSRTGTHMGRSDFKLRKSVAVSYQYEYQSLPGEPSKTRNWKFLSTDRGEVIHLNEGALIIKRVNSTAKVTSNSSINQEFSGIVDVGMYIGVGPGSVRIHLNDTDFSGSVQYNISEVKK